MKITPLTPFNSAFPMRHTVWTCTAKWISGLCGRRPVGALMKVTPLSYREVKLLHLATATWGQAACLALEMTLR